MVQRKGLSKEKKIEERKILKCDFKNKNCNIPLFFRKLITKEIILITIILVS